MTETSFGKELKNKLLKGVQKLNNSVASTLGPAGRTVLIKDKLMMVQIPLILKKVLMKQLQP